MSDSTLRPGIDTGASVADQRRGERRRANSLVLVERRSGFDRRQTTWPVARLADRALRQLRDEPLTLLMLLAGVNVLNVLDQAATGRALAAGFTEGNPVMAALISYDPMVAAGVKLLAVLGVTVSVWMLRRYRVVLQVGVLTFALFTAVLLWHFYGATLY
jgi:hypothetical protein